MPCLPIRALLVLAGVALLVGCAACTRSPDRVATGRPTPAKPTQSAQSSAAPSISHGSPPEATVRHVRECTRHDLTARFRPRTEGGTDGAGGHRIHLLDFTDVSATPCLLRGYPWRVVAYAPGEPSITATNGSVFPISPSTAMLPGHVTSIGLETDANCGTDGGATTGVLYRDVRVYLPGGVIDVALPHSDGLDAGCAGLHLTPFGIWL